MRRAWSLCVMIFCVIVVTAHARTAPFEARKFDEFGDVNCEEEQARLDNFANELQNNPDVEGYIVFYGGKRDQNPTFHNSGLVLPRRGEAEARVARLNHSDASSYAKNFSGKYAHRVIKGRIGHNPPQEAPQAFAKAVIEVDGY